ncbi:MAG: P-loop NTPase [Actinomycetota bacterium]|nr:P-loop NTPase [Actinomycetota bacterium]
MDRELAAGDIERRRKFRIAVVESDAGRLVSLAGQLGERLDVVSFSSLQTLQGELRPGAPIVVVLGPSFSEPAELAHVEWLSRTWSDVGLILVVQELTTELLQQAMRAGVKDVLACPDRAQLTWAVERVADSLAVEGSEALDLAAPPGEAPGKVITVFSPKGGSGTSVAATNLAVLLARRSPGKVALVDADLQFGDVAVMLKTKLEHSIVDAAAAGEGLDPPLLERLMDRHEPSGLMALAAPIEPALAEKVGVDDIRRIIELLRGFCDYVVVDTASYLNDVVLSLVEHSDELVLVSTMEVPSVKNLKLALEVLRALDTPASKLKLVLIRPNAKVQMEVRDIERALVLKASIVVPNDAAVPVSVNKCVPVVIDDPRSSVARSLGQLADLFLPTLDEGRRRAPLITLRRSRVPV